MTLSHFYLGFLKKPHFIQIFILVLKKLTLSISCQKIGQNQEKRTWTGFEKNILPITSKWMELSIGKGSDRYVKGSNLTLSWLQTLQVTLDLSWPWYKSTIMDWFLLMWFSQASMATTSSGRPKKWIVMNEL